MIERAASLHALATLAATAELGVDRWPNETDSDWPSEPAEDWNQNGDGENWLVTVGEEW